MIVFEKNYRLLWNLEIILIKYARFIWKKEIPRLTMSMPKKSLPKKCQFNTQSHGIPHENRRNSGTKSQVPINQIYTSTFDFEESIGIIKTKGWRLQSRENCEKGTEYRNRLEVKLIIFYHRFFPGTFPRFLTLLLRCHYNTYDY